jgi:PAS domain S-box-containing protein
MNIQEEHNINELPQDSLHVGKVLVVDDEPSIRKSLKGILERHNYRVDTAEKYSEIKEKLFSENYDALILDIILPEINGVEILHLINKAEINLPTIMLTGAPSLDTAQESVKYGAFDYLIKPVEPHILLNQLKNAVYKKKLVDTKINLNEQIKKKNEELEDLIEQRTNELRISEVRYRTVVESVQDMIIILDAEGIIKFANIVFLDAFSEAVGHHIQTTEVLGKLISEYVDTLESFNLSNIIKKVSEGQEFDFMECKLDSKYNFSSEYRASLRGIFNEDLELQEIILVISEKKQ